jgi:hypothetical protein
MRKPPTMGPAATANPPRIPGMANAAPLRSGGKMLVMIAICCGVIIAPPTPCRARAMISWVGSWARPQKADATVNSAMPARKRRLGPKMSPSLPEVIRSAANTRT